MPKEFIPIQKKNQPYLLCLDTETQTFPMLYRIQIRERGFRLQEFVPLTEEQIDAFKTPALLDIEAFIKRCLTVTESCETPFGELYDAYTAGRTPDQPKALHRAGFGRLLAEALPSYRSISRRGARYVNLAIKQN